MTSLPLVNSVIEFISLWKYRKIHVDFHFVFTLMFVFNFLLSIYRVFPICMAFFHITSRLKKMEMQMEYFFWTAMLWVCLEITMSFSTMHYYMSLVLPSQSILLFAALSSLYIIRFLPPLLDSVNKLTIIRRWWAKYRDLSVVSRDQ